MLKVFCFCCWLAVALGQPKITSETLDSDPVSVVSKLTAEYNKLSGPAFDFLHHLKWISESSKFFMKLTGPAGSILAACIDQLLPPEDPLLKALGILHDQIERRFTEQKNIIEGGMNRIRAAFELNDYDTFVHVPMNALSTIFRKILDPKKVRKWKREFFYACTEWNLAPKFVLNYINQKVNVNCHSIPKSHLADVNKTKRLFDSVFRRLRDQKGSTDYVSFYAIYLQTIERFALFSKSEAQHTVSKLRQLFGKMATNNSTNLIELNTSLTDLLKGPTPETCLLRSVYESYSSRRRPLLRFAEVVTHDALRLALMGGLCANFSHAPDHEKTKEEIEEIAVFTKDILGNVSEWVSMELSDAWPMEIERHIEKAIVADVTDPYLYNYTAEIINHEVVSRGPFGYVSQVLVTLNWDRFANFWLRCPFEHCLAIHLYHGINIVVVRHRLGEEKRAIFATKWFEEKQTALTEFIKENDKISNLIRLTEKIESAVGPLTSEDRYRSFVMVHVSSMTSAGCVLNVGITSAHFANQSWYSYLEVYTHYWIITTNDERFKVYLFL